MKKICQADIKYYIFFTLLLLTAMNFKAKFFYFILASTIVCFYIFKNSKVDAMFFFLFFSCSYYDDL